MDENKTIFDTVTLDAEEIRKQAEADAASDGRLEIFGEGDGALSKGGVKYKKPKLLYWLIALLAGLILGGLITIALVSSVAGGLSNLRLIKDMGEYDSSVISELLHRIDQYHFGETPSSDKLIEKASHALVDAMEDPYASYFTKAEYEAYTQSFNGNYYGIGVLISAPDGTGALIHRVYEGSFAEAAGLKAFDIVTKVDGKDITNLSSSELVALITGEEGTTVDITYLRDGEENTVTVTRGEVYIKRVDSLMFEGDIGYILLTSFSGDAVNEFRAALDDLTARGAKSLIVDLRNDPGGSLWTVIDICDMLLPKCTIVSMQGKTTDPTQYFESDKDMYDIEFVVLVNEYSASASEIFAGAMQDNGRAKIIGVKTYGKGVVQTTFPLEKDRGYIKLTTDAYFTPNGTNLGGTGVTPDIIAELDEELSVYDIYTLVTEHFDEDTQLQAAIKELTGK